MAPRLFPWLVAPLAVSFALRVASADPPAAPAASSDSALSPAPSSTQRGFPPHSLVWHEKPLIDPYLSFHDKHGDVGLVTEQPVGGGPGSAQGGFVLGFGQVYENRKEHLLARLERDWWVRLTGKSHVVLDIPTFAFLGGPRLGPLALTGGVGLGLLQFHFGDGGFGFGMFSPRAIANASLTFGPVRVGVEAYDEYAWRWTSGGSSAFVRGVLLEIGLVAPPELPEKYRLER